MALKVYVAYGTASDQVTALRLQALGAVNGLIVYVPPAYTRKATSGHLDPHSKASLENADVVLGVMRTAISETCRQELNASKTTGKTTIVMAEPPLAGRLAPYFQGNLVAVNPADPSRAEIGVVQSLNQAKIQRGARKALIALGILALGLLLFASQD